MDHLFKAYQKKEAEVSLYKEQTMLAVNKLTVANGQGASSSLFLDETGIASDLSLWKG